MRELLEDMDESNARMRHPYPLLDIGGTLYPYCGHIGFKQYNPNKPAKHKQRTKVDSSFWEPRFLGNVTLRCSTMVNRRTTFAQYLYL